VRSRTWRLCRELSFLSHNAATATATAVGRCDPVVRPGEAAHLARRDKELQPLPTGPRAQDGPGSIAASTRVATRLVMMRLDRPSRTGRCVRRKQNSSRDPHSVDHLLGDTVSCGEIAVEAVSSTRCSSLSPASEMRSFSWSNDRSAPAPPPSPWRSRRCATESSAPRHSRQVRRSPPVAAARSSPHRRHVHEPAHRFALDVRSAHGDTIEVGELQQPFDRTPLDVGGMPSQNAAPLPRTGDGAHSTR